MTVVSGVAVFLGAGLGALLRWAMGTALNPIFPTLPLGTLAANLLGGLLIGLAIAWTSRHPGISPDLRLLVITGYLGGLTTFSTFSAEIVTMLSRREILWGLLAVGAHVFGTLTMTAIGIGLVRLLTSRGG